MPTEIGLRTNLIGPDDEIRRRLREYAAAGVDELRVNPMGDTLDDRLAGLARLLELAADVAVDVAADPAGPSLPDSADG